MDRDLRRVVAAVSPAPGYGRTSRACTQAGGDQRITTNTRETTAIRSCKYFMSARGLRHAGFRRTCCAFSGGRGRDDAPRTHENPVSRSGRSRSAMRPTTRPRTPLTTCRGCGRGVVSRFRPPLWSLFTLPLPRSGNSRSARTLTSAVTTVRSCGRCRGRTRTRSSSSSPAHANTATSLSATGQLMPSCSRFRICMVFSSASPVTSARPWPGPVPDADPHRETPPHDRRGAPFPEARGTF